MIMNEPSSVDLLLWCINFKKITINILFCISFILFTIENKFEQIFYLHKLFLFLLKFITYNLLYFIFNFGFGLDLDRTQTHPICLIQFLQVFQSHFFANLVKAKSSMRCIFVLNFLTILSLISKFICSHASYI
jgi:hypothetical protein